MTAQPKPSGLALLPLLLFLILFMGTGVFFTLQGKAEAFYLLPAPVAIIPAIILATLLDKAKIPSAIESFIKGAGHSNIIAMCLIFLLAGAFSRITTHIGAVEAAVNLGLSTIPPVLLIPGLFVLSSLIAMAIGTSVGTVAALGPIALGLAQKADGNLALYAGSLLSGAMFGDNLSLISDTTIAATRTQSVSMRAKLQENFIIALPTSLICIGIFTFIPHMPTHAPELTVTNGILIVPYLLILGLALLGLNVFTVLMLGILCAALMGFTTATDYGIIQVSQDIMTGFADNQAIFLLSLFTGGLSQMMEEQGGLEYLKQRLLSLIAYLESLSSPRFSQQLAQLAIALLVSVVNLFTANNTVAIVVVGKLTKELADKHGLSGRRSASVLDIFSCVVQGILPYGFQILLLASIFSLSPLQISSYSFYPMCLAIFAVLAILFRPDKRANEQPVC